MPATRATMKTSFLGPSLWMALRTVSGDIRTKPSALAFRCVSILCSMEIMFFSLKKSPTLRSGHHQLISGHQKDSREGLPQPQLAQTVGAKIGAPKTRESGRQNPFPGQMGK